MLRYLKEYRFYISLFFFVLIPIIAIDTTNREPRDYRFYDRAIIRLTSPVQTLITWSLDSLVSVYNKYIYLWHVRQDNASILEENRKLLTTIVNIKEAEFENTRLRKLLNFHEEYKVQSVVARVVARDISTEFRAIRINRGEEQGVKKDMAVINSEGVVGRVWRTTATTADVVTILDLLSALDAIDSRTRARGIVEGMTDELCQLKFALRTDDIQPGDLLITGSLGKIFPKGISIGSVSKVAKKTYGITQQVEVRPSVDFAKLEEVTVITKFQNAPVHVVALDPK